MSRGLIFTPSPHTQQKDYCVPLPHDNNTIAMDLLGYKPRVCVFCFFVFSALVSVCMLSVTQAPPHYVTFDLFQCGMF